MDKVRLGQIGTLLRERRGTLGVRDTAKEIGVSPATLSRIENGKQPDLVTFEKVCRWLGISPLEVLDAGGADGAILDLQAPIIATAHLRAKRQITPQLAEALGEMIIRAQYMYADEPDSENAE